MRLLLDTQVWLWMQVSPERFSPSALELVQDPATDLLLSAASSWEIAIKYALGRLPLPEEPARYVPDRLARSGVTAIAVDHASALRVATLPRHHADPFDRLVIAQAQVLEVPVMTSDRDFAHYDIDIHWATRGA